MIRQHLGIRFAAPPTGRRRWRPPDEVRGEPPLGTWAPDCPQPLGANTSNSTNSATRAPGQDEDCLFLNIWAPEGAEGLPVLVWFYGGMFLMGATSAPTTDGAQLAAQGCVVVSAAYRVGLLGFLAHPALTAESPNNSSGNYGLLDIIAALRWVRDSIAQYGGDPQRITAFGVSAGSASLALLQTSPLAAGLFDGLILQSPGAFRPLAPLPHAEAAANDAYGPDIGAMRAWASADVVAHAAALVPRMRALTAPRLVRPIRDGWVIPADDRESYGCGRFHAVPTIVGGVADEGSKLSATWTITTVDDYRALLSDTFDAHADEALSHYPATADSDVRVAVADLFADTQFAFGARGIARAVSTRQPDTWRYLATWHPPGATGGPHHGDEVSGLFARSTPPGRAMADAWLNFATTGNPNNPNSPHPSTVWPRYTASADETLRFDDPPLVTSHWRAAQLDFIERYYDDHVH